LFRGSVGRDGSGRDRTATILKRFQGTAETAAAPHQYTLIAPVRVDATHLDLETVALCSFFRQDATALKSAADRLVHCHNSRDPSNSVFVTLYR
jgi:hypothetical protein